MIRSDTKQMSDREILIAHNQFIRDDTEDQQNIDKWEIRMTRNYYNKLFKEFALIDLTNYKKGVFGLRWRTESEVIKTKGQYICGSTSCNVNSDLHSYELPFQYLENSQTKFELVKVRLCDKCAKKLYKKKLKEMNLTSTTSNSSTQSNNRGQTEDVEIIENPKKKKPNPDEIVDLV